MPRRSVEPRRWLFRKVYSHPRFAGRAVELYRQAFRIFDSLDDVKGKGKIFGNLGQVWTDRKDFRRALRYHLLHVKQAQRVDDFRGISKALSAIGGVYRLMGRINDSIDYLRKAKRLAREAGDELAEAQVCWGLGLSYIERGNKIRAVKLMRVLVDHEKKMNHADAEKDNMILESIKRDEPVG